MSHDSSVFNYASFSAFRLPPPQIIGLWVYLFTLNKPIPLRFAMTTICPKLSSEKCNEFASIHFYEKFFTGFLVSVADDLSFCPVSQDLGAHHD